MNAQTLTTDVLIIGAGPTGMVAALCLARHGVRSVIVERREGLQAHPKAHEVSARTLEILHGLGFSHEALRAEASPHDDAARVLFCGTLQEEFGRIDLATGGGAEKYREHLAAPEPYLNLSQVELEKILLARVRETAHTELRYSHQWESFSHAPDGVVSRVVDRRTGDELRVESRYVLCADGAGSRTRAALGVKMVGPEKLRDFVNAYIQADLSGVVGTRGKLYFIFSPKCPGSVFIAHHIERRWVFHTPVATPYEKVEDITPEVITERIKMAIGRDDVPITITSMSSWRMTAQVADRFRVGRCFLAGDAAHRFPPTGGLGMNSGIGDAHNLCWKLARVIRGESPDALLDTYETERRPVIQTNCDESRRNFDKLSEIVEAFGLKVDDIEWLQEQMHSRTLAALPSPVLAWSRKQVERVGASVLARFNQDAAVRERVTAAIAQQRPHFDRIGLDLGYTYARGAVLPDGSPPPRAEHSVTEYVPSTRPGARFPHFWLDGRRGARSSHTLIDYGASTLVYGAAASVSAEERGDLDAAAAELRVRLFGLDDASVPLSHRAAAHAFCQLDEGGALFLRPDGHVGWRQRGGVRLTAALLRSIVRELYDA